MAYIEFQTWHCPECPTVIRIRALEIYEMTCEEEHDEAQMYKCEHKDCNDRD